MQSLGRKVGFDDEKIRLIILHGAIPKIKENIALIKADPSIEEMERVANVVESSMQSNKSSLEQAIKRVEMKVDAMNVAMNTGQDQQDGCYAVEPEEEIKSRLAVQYRNQRLQNGQRGQNNGYQNNSYRGNSYSNSGYQSNGYRQGGRGQEVSQGRGYVPRQGQYMQRGTSNGSGPNGPQRNPAGPLSNRNQQGRERVTFSWDCQSCGESSLHAYSRDGSCPALQMQCYQCGRVGHLRRCCGMTGPRGQSSGGPSGPPQ